MNLNRCTTRYSFTRLEYSNDEYGAARHDRWSPETIFRSGSRDYDSASPISRITMTSHRLLTYLIRMYWVTQHTHHSTSSAPSLPRVRSCPFSSHRTRELCTLNRTKCRLASSDDRPADVTIGHATVPPVSSSSGDHPNADNTTDSTFASPFTGCACKLILAFSSAAESSSLYNQHLRRTKRLSRCRRLPIPMILQWSLRWPRATGPLRSAPPTVRRAPTWSACANSAHASK